MQIQRLFKVLVAGGTMLTAGCGEPTSRPPVQDDGVAMADGAGTDAAMTPTADVVAPHDVASRADGVSSWMSWFVDLPEEDVAAPTEDAALAEDAAPDVATAAPDVAAEDASAADGVFAWLSWV